MTGGAWACCTTVGKVKLAGDHRHVAWVLLSTRTKDRTTAYHQEGRFVQLVRLEKGAPFSWQRIVVPWECEQEGMEDCSSLDAFF